MHKLKMKQSNFNIFKHFLNYLVLCIVMIDTTASLSIAQNQIITPKRKPNPFLNTIYSSQNVSELFNYYFQKNLEEKEGILKSQNKNYNPERFKARNYLFQLPLTESYKANNNANPDCNLNNPEYLNRQENPYLKQTEAKENTPFPMEANKAYCFLQNTFQEQSKNKLKMIENISVTNNKNSIRNRISSLSKKDTLVIIIPSIFGEYLPQSPFGELFGPRERNSTKTQYQSSFNLAFDQYIKNNKLDQADNKNEGLDSRFLMKNLREFYNSNENYKKLYKIIPIPEWIRVASIDDYNKNPLIKFALLEFDPMSLESLGKQEELAIIYLRRLNKFMSLYEKQNGKLPDQIIFIGYSRGAPIAYEILSILKNGPISNDDPEASVKTDLANNGQKWFQKIVAAVSLGGLDMGSPLADINTLFRNKTPDEAKALQALLTLMLKIEVITQKDINTLQNVFQSAMSRNYLVAVNSFQLFLTKNEKSLIRNVTKKVKINLEELKKFLHAINELEVKKTGENIGRGLLAMKDLATIYSNLNELIQSNGSSLSQIAILKKLFDDLNQDKLGKIFNELLGISQSMYPNLSNASLPSQNELLDEMQSALKNPSSINLQSPQASNNLLNKISEIIWKNSNPSELSKEIETIVTTTSNKDELSKKLKSIISSSASAQDLIAKVKDVISKTPSQDQVINKINTLIDSSPNPDDLLPIKSSSSEKMINSILGNYGLTQSQEITINAFARSDFFTLLKEINLNIKMFRHYFLTLWDSASEISSLARLSWLSKHAKYLPTHFSYYSFSAIQPEPSSSLYKLGNSFGFNTSSDQVFLNKNWYDLRSVGNTGADGLNATFSGTVWNDSHSDWHRTIMWPYLVKTLANDPFLQFRTKILGIARTHHWGLALPYVVHNKTSNNELTGQANPENQRVDNINPFPRLEMLKAIVMTIDADTEAP